MSSFAQSPAMIVFPAPGSSASRNRSGGGLEQLSGTPPRSGAAAALGRRCAARASNRIARPFVPMINSDSDKLCHQTNRWITMRSEDRPARNRNRHPSTSQDESARSEPTLSSSPRCSSDSHSPTASRVPAAGRIGLDPPPLMQNSSGIEHGLVVLWAKRRIAHPAIIKQPGRFRRSTRPHLPQSV